MALTSIGIGGILVVCSLGSLPQAQSFNVDVRRVRVFRGEANTAFGYTAEFIRWRDTGKTGLLVGAPKTNITDRDDSGIFYDCDVSSESNCTKHATRPAKQRPANRKAGPYGEEEELFGLSLTMADHRTAVMCGPLWQDVKWWFQNNTFWIGRCQTLTEHSHSDMITPYRNSSLYLHNIHIPGTRGIYDYLYGSAESGFSADSDGNGRVVLGAPGFSMMMGGVTVVDVRSGNEHLMTTPLDTEPYIELGYAVAVGKFCNPPRFCFAVSNRQALGKVYLLEMDQSGQSFTSLWNQTGEQEYSSFGSSLCAADVTGDGWADLLVGAPTFTHYGNDSHAYDQGRVFVYISKGQVLSGQDYFLKGHTLKGDERSFSRFGSAISSIGDINRDSINDIAVGAPVEEEGAGAVYIYLGTRQGPANTYSQKIRGKDFTPPLSSFGSHVSKPTSELSDYNYPAFAMGAPESSVALVFRTRPIVSAHVDVQATPNPVEQTNQLCPKSRGSLSGCVNVTVCLTVTNGITDKNDGSSLSLDFQVKLEVDVLMISKRTRRVRLYDEEKGTTTTSLTVPLTLDGASKQCQTFLAFLLQDQIDRNPFVPIELTASFSLNTTDFPDIAPMLNQSMPNSVTHQLRFKNQCGQDERCQTDLSLSGHVEYMQPSDVSYPFNVINHTKQVKLVLEVVNSQETSFGLKLTVNLTGHMDFWTVTGNTSMLCDDLHDSVLHCQGWTPLGSNKTVQIRLKFLADSVPLEPRNRVVTFLVKVMPSDPVENPEMDETNNVKRLESRRAIVADVRLDGSSTPSVRYVADSDQADVSVVHKVLVTNRGPSFLPPTVLNVTLPFRDATASDILLAANVTMEQGGVVVECPQVLTTGSVVGEATSTPGTLTTPSSSTRPGSGGDAGRQTTRSQSGGGSSTTDDPFGEIAPSRRRREAGNEQRAPASDKNDGRTKRMDCGNYQCRTYQCPLMTMQAKMQAKVNVTVTLNRAAIAFHGKVRSLLYVTTVRVRRPHTVLFYPWSEPKVKKVETVIRRVSEGDEISIWYIVGGITGGLLLLLLIGWVAWKYGFFARKDKARLRKLKRDSGFYGDMAMPVRTQRASTSDGAKKTE